MPALFRLLVRLLSVLCGLAVAAAGLVLLVGVAWLWLLPGDRTPHAVLDPARAVLARLTWSAPSVLGIAAIVLAAGIVALLITLAARRRDIRLDQPAPGVLVLTSPRSLARLVGRQVRGADGVQRAVVTASRTSVRVKARSRWGRAAELRDTLRELATSTLDGLPMARRPRISVSVHSAKDA